MTNAYTQGFVDKLAEAFEQEVKQAARFNQLYKALARGKQLTPRLERSAIGAQMDDTLKVIPRTLARIESQAPERLASASERARLFGKGRASGEGINKDTMRRLAESMPNKDVPDFPDFLSALDVEGLPQSLKTLRRLLKRAPAALKSDSNRKRLQAFK